MLTIKKLTLIPFFSVVLTVALIGCQSGSSKQVPDDIQAIFNKPLYKNATWGLRVVNLDTEKEIINLAPHQQFLIGSVRKIFTIGQLLNAVGPTHQYNTPVYRQGQIDSSGVLQGDLILVASGDLTMGGRTNPDGTVAYTNIDHNEANSLGNALLTKPDPLAGYTKLAQQVAQSGIRQITGNVIIDDRLFQPFNFRNQFNVTPIFVNDDVVDLIINPSSVGNPASLVYRPVSAALLVNNALTTGPANSPDTFALNPKPPEYVQCIGQVGCSASVTGQIPGNFIPPFIPQLPYIQTFRITQPSNYARTVFIEALQAAGVTVNAPGVAPNPVQLLPAKNSYTANAKVAELQGLPASENAKLVLKVSYNIGADTSLVLFGLTQGADNITDALKLEQQNLQTNYGISSDQYHFIDGSGEDQTTATNHAVVKFLMDMAQTNAFMPFFNAMPILGVDGSLGTVTQFQSDPTLAGATGQVHAKTGTYIEPTSSGYILRGQALGGYIITKNGRRLAYELVVNNVPISGLDDVLKVFQDSGTISAILWRDN